MNATDRKFSVITSIAVPLPVENVDTDQIIPARFLRATSKDGFGEHLFNDWRYRSDGSENPDFVLNDPRRQGARILLAGRNFGCGSSREHAAWALRQWGLRVVVSSFFADIHRVNELNNFLLPVVVSEGFLRRMTEAVEADPSREVEVDLPRQTITLLSSGESETFPIDPYKKECLLMGLDDIDYLLRLADDTEAWERDNEKL